MSFDQTFLAPEAGAYLDGLIPLPFPVMRRIEEEALKEGQPAVGRQTGGALRSYVLAQRATRVLEVGCNLGYSALWMAAGLPPKGVLHTIELDADLVRRARAHFADAGLARQVTVLEGAALDVLPTLGAQGYDLVFLDAVKAEYPEYLDHAMRLLRPGGILLADNLFWRGRSWSADADDPDSKGVKEYTRRIFADARLASTLVPVEDGLGVSVLRDGNP